MSVRPARLNPHEDSANDSNDTKLQKIFINPKTNLFFQIKIHIVLDTSVESDLWDEENSIMRYHKSRHRG